MHELITMIAQRLGVDENAARQAVGGVLQLMRRKMGDAEFQQVLSKIPGAKDAPAGAPGGEDAGGLPKILNQSGIGAERLEPFMSTFLDYVRVKAGGSVAEQIMGHFPKLQRRLD